MREAPLFPSGTGIRVEFYHPRFSYSPPLHSLPVDPLYIHTRRRRRRGRQTDRSPHFTIKGKRSPLELLVRGNEKEGEGNIGWNVVGFMIVE